jgi:hypothetical protein
MPEVWLAGQAGRKLMDPHRTDALQFATIGQGPPSIPKKGKSTLRLPLQPSVAGARQDIMSARESLIAIWTESSIHLAADKEAAIA